MAHTVPIIKVERFSIADPDTYIIFGSWPDGCEPHVTLGGQELETKILPWDDRAKGFRPEFDEDKGLSDIRLEIRLPKGPLSGTLVVEGIEENGRKFSWCTNSAKALEKMDRCPHFFIEQATEAKEDGCSSVNGWTASPDYVDIQVFDPEGNKVDCNIRRFARTDVSAAYPECGIDENNGFNILLEGYEGNELILVFSCASGENKKTVYLGGAAAAGQKVKGIFGKTLRFVRVNGVHALPGKVVARIRKTDRPIEYKNWYPYHFPKEDELAEQRKQTFPYSPKISIVVPLYKTPSYFLDRMVGSVKAQTYGNWELCLSDGSGVDSPIADALNKLAEEDERIIIIPADEQRRIAENTNRAIEAASGEFIAFADHDDELAPNALFEVVQALNEKSDLDVIYTDEDKIDENSKNYTEPQLKPEFNRELLRTVNYICHLLVVRKTLLDRAGYLNSEFEGAQDYDLTLRLIEMTDRIKRIPKILYHWRTHAGSTSEDPESKRYAFDAGRRAIQAHYDRCGIKAEVYDGEYPGLYRTKFIRDHDPLISILIPNKDHTDDLKRCVESLKNLSSYTNYEIIVIENNSEEEETFRYYDELKASDPKVNVVYYKGGFNFSKINNFGEQYANGEYLLLLNNDTEIIGNHCLEEMLGYCMLPDVGAVGARLYYNDDTIQHAGVVVGFGGCAGHCFVQQPRSSTGYCHRIICAQDYSAVTAACVMVDRKAYHEIGGMSEELAVAFNDIDMCLKLGQKGYKVVYNPYAELYHYESKSRGFENTPEKKARFNKEIDVFRQKWPDIFRDGDPYYNPNLTLKSQDFSLRRNH